jgi:hypothetical protein
LAAAWRQCSGSGSISGNDGSPKHGHGAQRDGSSAVAALPRLRRWWQRNSATSAAAWRWRGNSDSISSNGGSATARGQRWRQHASATSAAAWRQHGSNISGGGSSTKRGGGAQRDGGSAAAVAASAAVVAAQQHAIGSGGSAPARRWRKLGGVAMAASVAVAAA